MIHQKFTLFIAVFFLSLSTFAQNAVIQNADLTMAFNSKGYFTAITVQKQQILHKGNYPLLLACANQKLFLPKKLEQKENLLICTLSDNEKIILKYTETPICITLEVVEIPEKYEALILLPVAVSLHDIVGDIIGVVQGNDLAFGIQGLNPKTNAGIPAEYAEQIAKQLQYTGQPAIVSVATIPSYRLAATDIGDGTMMQFSCRRRNETAYRNVQQLDNAMVLPVSGGDALIRGAKVAVFGCAHTEVLTRIGQIEIEQQLPHPLFDGEWGKTSRNAMASYLISDFSEQDFDFVLDKCQHAGFQYVYHIEPFDSWGHFTWNPDFVKGGDAEVKKLVDKAATRGIKVGIHTLSNFMTTNDAYVTPTPSQHLLKQGILTLANDLDASQTKLKIEKSTLFSKPMTLNALQIENELITYNTCDTAGDFFVLQNCRRGAFGTTPAAHSHSQPLYKLWDYPYKTLFPDLVLQDSLADRIVEIFNNTGLAQISFDGLEGCTYTGQDDYATARFVSRIYDGWNHNVLNDGSNLNHYTWHINTRMNWGEPWGEAMRTGQVANRIKNQDFFSRNLFPRMLGWFLIRLADRNFECTTLEDLEWAMSEAAGFDGGFAMTVYMKTLRGHGQIDTLLKAIQNWEQLRITDSFTKEQKAKLKDPITEWHLEKIDARHFLLFPLYISNYYRCDLAELQPGQPGGADWQWDSPNAGNFSFRLRVEGEGSITDPTLATPNGTIKFPCTIQAGQYLLYDSKGNATITDKNYNFIAKVQPQGQAALNIGQSTVSFSCSPDKNAESPVVSIRYITRDNPEIIHLKKDK